jgi:xanthine dehydrogenase YagT iron-sulfur-binding subunit
MVVSLKYLLDKRPSPSLDEIKHAVSGNVCRCGTYPRIFEAAQKACGGGK